MTEWISVKEKLPKECGDYLIWVSIEEFDVPTKYRTFISWWNGDFFENYCDIIRIYLDTITHWAELPQPPDTTMDLVKNIREEIGNSLLKGFKRQYSIKHEDQEDIQDADKEWINIDDKLPNEQTLVLLFTSTCGITTGYLWGNDAWMIEDDDVRASRRESWVYVYINNDSLESYWADFKHKEVLYWMTLPEVPIKLKKYCTLKSADRRFQKALYKDLNPLTNTYSELIMPEPPKDES